VTAPPPRPAAQSRGDTLPVVVFTVNGVPRGAAPSRFPDASVGLGRRLTVVYDGDCKVCTRLSRLLAAWDTRRQFEIVPSQAPGVKARFPWIPPRAYAESLQVIDQSGRTWQGAAALERIIDALPRGRLLSWVFSIPFVRPLAERLYRWFARNRYRLGCGEHCSYRGNAILEYEEND
jgi:predicted DCC family thiol-disulfide oxidoreductase YuxK